MEDKDTRISDSLHFLHGKKSQGWHQGFGLSTSRKKSLAATEEREMLWREQIWGQSFKQVTFDHLVDVRVEVHMQKAVE